MQERVPWADLPLEVLAHIASFTWGRVELYCCVGDYHSYWQYCGMRGVCSSWKAGFDMNVTCLWIGGLGKLCIEPPICPHPDIFPYHSSDEDETCERCYDEDECGRPKIVLPDLTNFHQLVGVRLEYSSLTDGSLAGLREAPKLQVLHLNLCHFSESAINILQTISSLVTLRLDMLNSSIEASNQQLHYIGRLRNVTVFGIDFADPELDDSSTLALSGMTQLEVLDISGFAKVSSLGVRMLRQFPRLRILYMQDWSFANCEAASFAALRGLPLTALDLSYGSGVDPSARVDDDFLKELRGLPLTSLNLQWCCKISDQGIESLVGMPLEILNLDGVRELTDESLVFLKGMPLTCLGLGYCRKLTSQGLAHLGGLPLTALSLDLQTYDDEINEMSKGLLALLNQGLPLQMLSVPGNHPLKPSEWVSEDLSSRLHMVHRIPALTWYSSPIYSSRSI